MFVIPGYRPDISCTVNIFSQFHNNLFLVYWHGLLKLFDYVCFSKSLKLNLDCKNVHAVAYSDTRFLLTGMTGLQWGVEGWQLFYLLECKFTLAH